MNILTLKKRKKNIPENKMEKNNSNNKRLPLEGVFILGRKLPQTTK